MLNEPRYEAVTIGRSHRTINARWTNMFSATGAIAAKIGPIR